MRLRTLPETQESEYFEHYILELYAWVYKAIWLERLVKYNTYHSNDEIIVITTLFCWSKLGNEINVIYIRSVTLFKLGLYIGTMNRTTLDHYRKPRVTGWSLHSKVRIFSYAYPRSRTRDSNLGSSTLRASA